MHDIQFKVKHVVPLFVVHTGFETRNDVWVET